MQNRLRILTYETERSYSLIPRFYSPFLCDRLAGWHEGQAPKPQRVLLSIRSTGRQKRRKSRYFWRAYFFSSAGRTPAQNANLSPSKGHFILPWKWPDLGRGEEGVIAVVSILLPPLNSDSVSVRSNVSRAFARMRSLEGRLFLLKEGWRGAGERATRVGREAATAIT